MISGRPISNLQRPGFYTRTIIPQAAILQLFTTPVTLVVGVPDIVHVPSSAHCYRQAGTAYTLPGAVFISVGATTLYSISSILTASVETMSFIGTGSNLATSALGLPVILNTSTNNPTNGTGDIIVTVYYNDYSKILAW